MTAPIVRCQWSDMIPERAHYCNNAVVKFVKGELIVLCDCPGRAKMGDCLKCGGV